ncbi:MAG: NifB/NifX family molybdenum-iron cluster-binding protein [Methanomassiliicoccales archaeon]
MKVCVPSMGTSINDDICQHFGRAPYYLIVDTEDGSLDVLENRGEHAGGVGKPPEHIAKRGVQVMICSSLGPKAIQMLENFNIRTYVGACGTINQAIRQWKEGKLRPADVHSACKEHRH